MSLTIPGRRPADLLQGYVPGHATLLSSPSGTMLAGGAAAVVPPGEGPDRLAGVGARAAATLDDARRLGLPALVVGALPFHPGVAPHLVVPEHLHRGDQLRAWPDDGAGAVFPATPGATPAPGPRDYAALVAQAVTMLRAGDGLDKVVLARALELRGGGAPDIAALVRRLAARDPWAHVYAVNLPSTTGMPRTLVGASPETLLRRRGDLVESLPLAGSAKRSADPCEDARRGAVLLCSEKDREEHAVVVRAIADALGPICSALEVPTGPELIRTRAMWHLATRIRGRLADPATSSLDLASVLHPTPAVCGLPRERARRAIEQLEPRDRGFYAGAVGWQDATGDGEWTVAIRCAEVEGDEVMRLWAGAGLVGDSDPEGELAETTAKFDTLLSAVLPAVAS